jgi:uncharacterized protein (DUF305 family)
MNRALRGIALLLLGLLPPAFAAGGAHAQQGPRTVQPGAPGDPGRAVATGRLAESARPPHTAADARFMQGMIPHHAQALEMTALVPARTERDDVRLLARRIELSQDDEIALMRGWLRARGESDAPADAHHEHGGHAALMPGMLTPEEMARLEAARGSEFDRLFLELMIRHHQGALTMVAELFAADGAGQEAEIFQFATEVDADQRVEIRRMGEMLGAVGR